MRRFFSFDQRLDRVDILLPDMSVYARVFRSLAALAELVPEIVYVMCGARGEARNRLTAALPRARFLGFEPDKKAYQRLARNPRPGHTYYKAAAGAREVAKLACPL